MTLLVAPQLSHWRSAFRDFGFIRTLYVGLVLSGFSEEFTRMLLQTRLAGALGNKGFGFVAASFVWCLTHVPVNHSQAPGLSLLRVAVASCSIMPVGLL